MRIGEEGQRGWFPVPLGAISNTRGCYWWDDAPVFGNNGNSRMDTGRKERKNRTIRPVYQFDHFFVQLTRPKRNRDQLKVRPADSVRFLKP